MGVSFFRVYGVVLVFSKWFMLTQINKNFDKGMYKSSGVHREGVNLGWHDFWYFSNLSFIEISEESDFLIDTNDIENLPEDIKVWFIYKNII